MFSIILFMCVMHSMCIFRTQHRTTRRKPRDNEVRDLPKGHWCRRADVSNGREEWGAVARVGAADCSLLRRDDVLRPGAGPGKCGWSRQRISAQTTR